MKRHLLKDAIGVLLTPVMGVPIVDVATMLFCLVYACVRGGITLAAMFPDYVPSAVLGTVVVIVSCALLATLPALVLVPSYRHTGILLSVCATIWLLGGGALIGVVETAGLMPGLPFAAWTVMCVGFAVRVARGGLAEDGYDRGFSGRQE